MNPFNKLLIAFFAFIVFLLAIRLYLTGDVHYVFLVWNIFLAWIPFAVSTRFQKPGFSNKGRGFLIFCCWLAFFPNALYIITDLIHLQLESTVPKWFDALLIFSASVLGLLMAFVSLYRAEKWLQPGVPKKLLAPLIFLILFLGSFGVYLGRFLRWNSWDIISNPMPLFLSVSRRVFYPFDHKGTWVITILFTVFFYLLYTSLKKVPAYINRGT